MQNYSHIRDEQGPVKHCKSICPIVGNASEYTKLYTDIAAKLNQFRKKCNSH